MFNIFGSLFGSPVPQPDENELIKEQQYEAMKPKVEVKNPLELAARLEAERNMTGDELAAYSAEQWRRFHELYYIDEFRMIVRRPGTEMLAPWLGF